MGELGDRLREAREERGLSYADVEEKTRIQDVFIRSLEEERFDDLPEGTYAKGLLRNYASFLGLNEEEILASYRSMTGEAAADIPRVLDEPLLGRTSPRLWGAIFLGIMIILICALAAWYAYNRFYLQRDPWPISRPQSTAPMATSTLGVDVTSTPSQAQASPTMEEEIAAPTEVDTPTQEPTPTATTAALATPTPAYTPRPTEAVTSTEGVVIQANLIAPTYAEVRSDGETVFTGVLEAGEERSWTAGERISMRVGNAGGISLTVNGVEVGLLGASGEVLDVDYTLDDLPES